MAPSKRGRVHDEDRDEENDQLIDLIHSESHFNFIKMHLLIHFGDHIRQFGDIPMYSREYGKLAHKEQIKDPGDVPINTMWGDRSCRATVSGMGFE